MLHCDLDFMDSDYSISNVVQIFLFDALSVSTRHQARRSLPMNGKFLLITWILAAAHSIIQWIWFPTKSPKCRRLISTKTRSCCQPIQTWKWVMPGLLASWKKVVRTAISCDVETETSNGLGSFVKADRVVEEIKIQYANKSTQVDIHRLKVRFEVEFVWARTTWTRRGFFYGSRANGEGIVVFGYCDSVFLYLYFTHILCDENTRGNLLSFTAVGKRKRSETRSINPERDSHSNVFSVDFTCVCVFVWINKQGKSTLNTFGAKKHAIREACSCFQWMANFHIAGSNWITPTWPKQSNPIRLCYLEV